MALFRKTLFILPNLFTMGNAFCGFFALTLCTSAASIEQLYQAALAICLGFFFDLFDGRVARLTRTQTDLGVELDSLADVVTFGAAPAMLVYKWGLSKLAYTTELLGLSLHLDIGIFIAFLFLAGGVYRLARYNVLAHRNIPEHSSPGSANKYFVGLPIPAAASIIVALVVVNYQAGGNYAAGQGAIAALVIVLGYLMASRVRFRSFKDLEPNKRTFGYLFSLVLISILIVARLRASFIFIFLVSSYLGLGLAEEIFRYGANKRQKRRAAKLSAGEPLAAEDEEEVDDEDEVLEELGAEDDLAS